MVTPTDSRTVSVFLSSKFRDFAKERDLLVRKVFSELLVMQYVDGSEFSVDVVAHEGEVTAMVCRRKPLNRQVRVSGSSLLTREPEMEDMVRLLVKLFCLVGLLNLQFRSAAERPERPYLLQINERMSGGLPYVYVYLSGLNLPFLAIQAAMLAPGEAWPDISKARLPVRVKDRLEVFITHQNA
jgi:predicted ATP-grasp superfamily ATP-dependent carboligase